MRRLFGLATRSFQSGKHFFEKSKKATNALVSLLWHLKKCIILFHDFAARLDTIRQSLEDRVKRYFEDEGLVASVNSDGLIDISSIPIDDSSFKMYYASSGRGRYYSIKEDRCIVLTAYR